MTESLGTEVTYWVEEDNAFCAAMRIAIAAGLEHPPAAHVVVDNTQPAPGTRVVHTYSELRSYGGSPAADCANFGHDFYTKGERP